MVKEIIRNGQGPDPAALGIAISRGKLLKMWLDERGVTNPMLARRLDLTPARVSGIIHGGSCPQLYIDVLRDEYGVPDELLPAPSRGTFGPVRGELARQRAHAGDPAA